MTRKAAYRRESGFTLIEVLAALVLSSLVLVSLNMAMGAVGKGVDHTRRSIGETGTPIAAMACITSCCVAPGTSLATPQPCARNRSGRLAVTIDFPASGLSGDATTLTAPSSCQPSE